MQEILDEFTGEKLKEKRDTLLLSQAELAEKIGVSRLTVLSWENNQSQPSRKHLRTLRTFFRTHRDIEE
jgi:DNA-binding XRE family transcriptional regulator